MRDVFYDVIIFARYVVFVKMVIRSQLLRCATISYGKIRVNLSISATHWFYVEIEGAEDGKQQQS